MAAYRDADKFLARTRRKQARKVVRNARDFNRIETRALMKFLFLKGKTPKEIHAILTEILASCLPGRAEDLSAPLILFSPVMRVGNSTQCTIHTHNRTEKISSHSTDNFK